MQLLTNMLLKSKTIEVNGVSYSQFDVFKNSIETFGTEIFTFDESEYLSFTKKGKQWVIFKFQGDKEIKMYL